jgi:hypothetical protein|nr:MAG TPA: Mnd1 HTH domain [Crassvirales sp.]
MNSRVNNIVRIPTSLQGRFFRYWVDFLHPYHKLTNRESEVITALLKERYNLSKKVSDPEILDTILMSDDIQRKVREECGMSRSHFQVIMGKLKKSGILENNKINPKFIPNIREDENSFQLLLLFELK